MNLRSIMLNHNTIQNNHYWIPTPNGIPTICWKDSDDLKHYIDKLIKKIKDESNEEVCSSEIIVSEILNSNKVKKFILTDELEKSIEEEVNIQVEVYKYSLTDPRVEDHRGGSVVIRDMTEKEKQEYIDYINNPYEIELKSGRLSHIGKYYIELTNDELYHLLSLKSFRDKQLNKIL